MSSSDPILLGSLVSFVVDTAASVAMSGRLTEREILFGIGMTIIEYYVSHFVVDVFKISDPHSQLLATMAVGWAIDTVSSYVQSGSFGMDDILTGALTTCIEYLLTLGLIGNPN